MRLYDYECKKCGLKFTYIQDGWEDKYNAPRCPKCGAKKPDRKISLVQAKTSNPPWDARHKRGTGIGTRSASYPLYSSADLPKNAGVQRKRAPRKES
ncbi:MAG: hypothetical protein AMXMBFR16_10980 [Candidatus Uhrbacteria bacterium]